MVNSHLHFASAIKWSPFSSCAISEMYEMQRSSRWQINSKLNELHLRVKYYRMLGADVYFTLCPEFYCLKFQQKSKD